MKTEFRTLDEFDTEFSADSVEWCPIDGFRDLFVCGTYQLEKHEESSTSNESKSKRIGRIYAFRVTEDARLNLLQRLDVPAVLDMKWVHIPYKNRILLGVVNSVGFLQVYELVENENVHLKLITEIRINEEEDCLALSLDWCSGRWTKEEESSLKAVVSDSKGFISVINVEESLNRTNSWHAHNFEAWIAAFDYWDTNVVYTGGDDCKFQRFDVRTDNRATAQNRVHGAGVTSIHSNASKEHLLCTGSYDEILRLWDTRNLKRPVSELNLGGGIWRLKWDPIMHRYLVAACMYGGFRLIDTVNPELPTIFGEYNEHESIAYGCDWCFMNDKPIPERTINTPVRLIGTCSFYDHALKLSAVYLENV